MLFHRCFIACIQTGCSVAPASSRQQPGPREFMKIDMKACQGSRLARFVFGPVMPRRRTYFLLLAQKKCKQRKKHPGSPVARRATPLRCSLRRAVASNSRDPLRGHALRQSPTDYSRRSCATRRLAGAPNASLRRQSVYDAHGTSNASILAQLSMIGF